MGECVSKRDREERRKLLEATLPGTLNHSIPAAFVAADKVIVTGGTQEEAINAAMEASMTATQHALEYWWINGEWPE